MKKETIRGTVKHVSQALEGADLVIRSSGLIPFPGHS
jgi:hypothetical protein